MPALTMFGRPSPKPIRIEVFGKTDLGKTRDHNEDRFLVADLTRHEASLRPTVRTHDVGERGSLFVVADGMGGAAAGEVASQMAADKIYDQMVKTWGAEREPTAQRFAFRLKEAVEIANRQIHSYAAAHPDVRGMGTTTTAAGLLGDRIFLTQVGDSRAYLIRSGQAVQLTKDQSLMQRLVEAGELTEEEAEKSERRNIILQALGPDARVKVDLTYQEVRRGDILVLCSDGLSSQVKREEIAEVVTGQRDLSAACDRLIALANERGGPDNITVVIVRFDGEGLRPVEASAEVGHHVYPLIDTETSTEPVPVYRGSRPPEPAARSRWRVVALLVAAPEADGGPAPARRSSTTVRIAAEVARQTRQLRRTTTLLIGVLVLALAAFAWTQWRSTNDAHELAQLQARADSLAREAQRLLARFQTELASLRDALRQSQAEVARLRSELAAAGSNGDVRAIARLRAELEAAESRQRGLAGVAAMDYRAISLRNQGAVAMVVVQFSDTEIFSGTAFAADSQGTLITNRHVLVGDGGNRRPLRIAVKFSGSREWFQARMLSVADSADVGAVKVDIHGGTPRVAGFVTEPAALARGDPVAIVGYPLGEDLPMERLGQSGIVADPTLTVGTVSKALSNVVQVDGYGAPGSSGSPIFDRSGRVAAVLYGGNRESQGKIIYAVPASQVVAYLARIK